MRTREGMARAKKNGKLKGKQPKLPEPARRSIRLRYAEGEVSLAERLDAIQRVMPRAERVVLPGLDHGADLKKPGEVARVIRRLAEKVLPGA
ncbi:hypothetical protein [Nonomuraea phyllanthi]|uniref:hypothetical protein n=1 Tax=Nonomuraea phyllanthi TaxID=2219224 RepID=UPI001D15945B|nr:hypothetical protein [Nonomuraea phyllanthi]